MAINQLGDGSADGVSIPGPIVGPATVGSKAADKVAFYGAIPVVQRATASTHTTSNCVSSSAFGAQQNAILLEVVNTLLALGIWAA